MKNTPWLLLIIALLMNCTTVFVGDEWGYVEQAQKLQQKGKYRQAIAFYLKAIQRDSYNTIFFPNIAECYMQLGELDSAQIYWERAVALDPQNIYSKANLIYLEFLKLTHSAQILKTYNIYNLQYGLYQLIRISTDTGFPPEFVLLIADYLSDLQINKVSECGGKGLFMFSKSFAERHGMFFITDDGHMTIDERTNPFLALQVVSRTLQDIIPKYQRGRYVNMYKVLTLFLKEITCLNESQIKLLTTKLINDFKIYRKDNTFLGSMVTIFLKQLQQYVSFNNQPLSSFSTEDSTTIKFLDLIQQLQQLVSATAVPQIKATLLYNIGIIHFYLNHYEQASTYFMQAMALDSANVQFKISRARLYFYTGNYNDAEKFYHSLMHQAPELVEIKLELAELYIIEGKLTSAQKLLLSLNPADPHLKNRVQKDLAILSFIKGNVDLAVQELSNLVNHESTLDFIIYYHLALFKAIQSQLNLGFQFNEVGDFSVSITDTLSITQTSTNSQTEFRPFIWPVESRFITSYFGWRPNLRGKGEYIFEFHTGIDIDGTTGDPIFAAADGEVVFAGWQGGYGKTVRIKHHFPGQSQPYYTSYHHMSKISVRIHQRVTSGEKIGEVGATGTAYGDHLHFDVQIGNQYVNPLFYLPIVEEYRFRQGEI